MKQITGTISLIFLGPYYITKYHIYIYIYITIVFTFSINLSLQNVCVYIYIYIYIYIYRKSASRFSRGTVLNMLKQSRINIMRGKKGSNFISRQACFVNRFKAIHETGLSGNVVASLFPSHNIYIYICIYLGVCVLTNYH